MLGVIEDSYFSYLGKSDHKEDISLSIISYTQNGYLDSWWYNLCNHQYLWLVKSIGWCTLYLYSLYDNRWITEFLHQSWNDLGSSSIIRKQGSLR